jgi:hypothetical protein
MSVFLRGGAVVLCFSGMGTHVCDGSPSLQPRYRDDSLFSNTGLFDSFDSIDSSFAFEDSVFCTRTTVVLSDNSKQIPITRIQ